MRRLKRFYHQRFLNVELLRSPSLQEWMGYARKFIKERLEDALIFEPCNIKEFIALLENYKSQVILREKFIKNFNREAILDEMMDSILELLYSRKVKII